MTSYEKQNDYTLRVIDTLPPKGDEKRELVRYFNFASAQVTTIYDSSIEKREKEGYGASASVGMAVAISSQMKIENFCDIQSYKEIELMHEELKRRGGRPPDLSGLLPILDKQGPHRPKGGLRP